MLRHSYVGPLPPPTGEDAGNTNYCTEGETAKRIWDPGLFHRSGVLWRAVLPGIFGLAARSAAKTPPPFIRLAGMQMCQRETMAPNHGHYFVDTSVSTTTQQN